MYGNENAQGQALCARDICLGEGTFTTPKGISASLLTLFRVKRYATEAWAVLFELKFLRTWTTQQHVIDVTCLLANEKCGFFLFLALGHG